MDESSLLDAVIAAPDAPGPRQVMADWLLDRGDPRGELIAVQCALASPGLDEARRTSLRTRQRELLYEHEAGWLAAHGLQPGEGEFVRGFLEVLTLRGSRLTALRGLARCPLRKLRAIDVCAATLPALVELPNLSGLESLHLAGELGGAEIRTLLTLSSLSRLHTLDLAKHKLGREGVAALASSPHLRSLARLDLSANLLTDQDIELLAASSTLVSLTELSLAHNGLGPLAAHALARSPVLQGVVLLDLQHNQLDAESARALASSPWLTRLVRLDLGHNRLGPEGALALAACTSLPSLAWLGLRHNAVGAEGVQALLDSPSLQGVRSFDTLGNLDRGQQQRLFKKYGARM